VAEAQFGKHAPGPAQTGAVGNGSIVAGEAPGQPQTGSGVEAAPRPRRFYAKITLDPNRPTPQVSNIAQSILSELDRARGTKITLTLDIEAETANGFPEDVEGIIRDNAATLRITDFGFAGE
jgi:hypothetical protein